MELRRRRRGGTHAERLADAAECVDHRHRAGQHRRHARRVVPNRLPRELLALHGPWLPVPAAYDADMEPHEGMRIGVLHDLNLPTVIVHRANLDGQLFAELPAKRVRDAFPGLHLAAGKLPRAGARRSFRSGVQQKTAIRTEQDADGHRDGGMVMRLHDADETGDRRSSDGHHPSKGPRFTPLPFPWENSTWGKCPAAATLIATKGPSEIVLMRAGVARAEG